MAGGPLGNRPRSWVLLLHFRFLEVGTGTECPHLTPSASQRPGTVLHVRGRTKRPRLSRRCCDPGRTPGSFTRKQTRPELRRRWRRGWTRRPSARAPRGRGSVRLPGAPALRTLPATAHFNRGSVPAPASGGRTPAEGLAGLRACFGQQGGKQENVNGDPSVTGARDRKETTARGTLPWKVKAGQESKTGHKRGPCTSK